MPITQLQLPASCLDFLTLLKQNNNREWFARNKEEFEIQQKYIELFASQVLDKLNTHDVIETVSGKKSIYRIYRDSRFSTDKTPYKIHWSGHYTRASKYRRGGYYFHLEPGNTYIAGGFHAMAPKDLRLVRNDISYDALPLRQIIQNQRFISTFGIVRGAQVPTSPKGYSIDHKDIDLLRYKQFRLVKKFSDQEVLSPSFLTEVNETYLAMRPFFDYMSHLLSFNINGEDI